VVNREGWLGVTRQALPVLLVSLAAGLFAGTVLGSEEMRSGIESVPGLLLLPPAFLATRGGVHGALGARLSSVLHQGVIEPRFQLDERRTNALVACFLNGMIVSLFVGVLAWGVMAGLGRSASLVDLVVIPTVAGLLSALVMPTVLVGVLFVGYRRGLDPDNPIGPTVTTVGDVLGVIFLLVGLRGTAWLV
jgi:mgtE-like transporter